MLEWYHEYDGNCPDSKQAQVARGCFKYFFCSLNIPEFCRTIKRWRYLTESKGVRGPVACFPERILSDTLTCHLTVTWRKLPLQAAKFSVTKDIGEVQGLWWELSRTQACWGTSSSACFLHAQSEWQCPNYSPFPAAPAAGRQMLVMQRLPRGHRSRFGVAETQQSRYWTALSS